MEVGLNKMERIKDLEKLAREVLVLKQEIGLRRPLVVEFCGTPKAGKTTTITSLNIFLKRNDFRTIVINEMATECPIRNKTNYFFNSWTFFSSMAEVLKHVALGQSNTDIILIDRSLFDSLCWFKWLSNYPDKNPYISQEQYQTFVNFLVGTNMWIKHFDLIYIFKTTPTAALRREFSELLTTKTGSIMNQRVIEEFNKSVSIIKETYQNRFRKIEEYDTTSYDANIVSYDVTYTILNNLRDILTEKVGYFLDSFALFLKDGVNPFELVNSRLLHFKERHIVEKENFIQPVAIGVITDSKREHVLVLKKNDLKTTKDSPEHNRLLLYLGGHLRIEDSFNVDRDNLLIMRRALKREIKEELDESITLSNEQPFLIYTPTNEKSKRHIAVCFVIEMDLENKKFYPTREEFIYKNPTSKSGTIVRVKDLINYKEEFEPWSLAILSHVFKVNKTLFD